ncbi:hypothetical protein GGTG_11640 [Gaeumannomyces tritici R3-111a-1]|uniref:Clr5 domain-containing protein n=1 Tax=Gaeumannomyces tritici (strain R3-111a-1) TaxID=644352 RepID=J3PDR7_GAET3|nr:hypothetical protein GGTG_11640 [Gaeumannomyces tritici R3-111a-1]EJT70617.1 hypothetical protein GGTG_11640 [Gaeumannomyces tritici R3-111a-1]
MDQLRPHQSLLKTLYIEQDLKMDKVMLKMKTDHGVTAGRTTYERIFKQWGFSKNKPGRNWEWVYRKLRRRRLDGRDSALYVDGKRKPQATIKKEIARYVTFLRKAQIKAGRSPSPGTPEGYHIQTPESTPSMATPGAAATPDAAATPSDNSNEIDSGELVAIIDTLQECGAFISVWGASGRSASAKRLQEIYQATARAILSATGAAQDEGISAELAPLATSYKILLATHQQDQNSLTGLMAESNKSTHRDVYLAALFLAAKKGATGMVELLLDGAFKGSEPKNNAGQTCLHIASVKNHPALVEVLLGRDHDANKYDRAGFTPWTAICYDSSHEEVSRLLIQAGARVNVTNPVTDMNAMYQAAAGGHVESVQTLIRRGADPSYRTPFRWAPLHFARGPEIVKILLEANAEINPLSGTGRTPLDMHFQNEPVRRLLEEAGAKRAQGLRTIPRRPWQSPAAVLPHYDVSLLQHSLPDTAPCPHPFWPARLVLLHSDAGSTPTPTVQRKTGAPASTSSSPMPAGYPIIPVSPSPPVEVPAQTSGTRNTPWMLGSPTFISGSVSPQLQQLDRL